MTRSASIDSSGGMNVHRCIGTLALATLLLFGVVFPLRANGADADPTARPQPVVLKITVIEIAAPSDPPDAAILDAPRHARVTPEVIVGTLDLADDGAPLRILSRNGDEPPFELIGSILSSPRLLTDDGQTARLVVGQSVVHLEPQSDGRWRLVEDDTAREGIFLDVTPVRDRDAIEMSVVVTRQSVVDRERAAATELPIGRPVIAGETVRAQRRLTEDHCIVLTLPESVIHGPALAIVVSIEGPRPPSP